MGRNVKMDIQELGCGTWTGLIWFRMVRGSTNLLIRKGTLGSIKYGEFVD